MVVGIERLHALLDELGEQDVTGTSLRDELLELDRARARLDVEVARRLRAFDRSQEWSVEGSRSAAAFLSKHTRCARGEASHRVRVARQIGELDATAAAWAAGDVTTKHVEAIARARHAAKADDAFADFESALLGVARASTPDDVAGASRQWRDALDVDLDRDGSDSIAEHQHERRKVDYSRSIDGMGFGTITLETLDAEIFETALHQAYETLHREHDSRTPAQQRADALVEIARVYLDSKTYASRSNLPNVLLLADEATVAGDTVGDCRLASGYRVAPETARRLLCDANVQTLQAEDGVPLALSRAVRTFTPHQFRALVARDAYCRGPSCRVGPEHCEAHHLDEWERDDGATDLDNGGLFCRGFCHRMLHEGGWKAVGDPNGELRFFDRDGKYIGSSVPYQPPQPIKTRRRRNRHTDYLTRERVRELQVAREERVHVVAEARLR